MKFLGALISTRIVHAVIPRGAALLASRNRSAGEALLTQHRVSRFIVFWSLEFSTPEHLGDSWEL